MYYHIEGFALYQSIRAIAFKLFSHAEIACPEFILGFQHLFDHYTDPEIPAYRRGRNSG